jgi:hypothetical protein
MHRASLVSCFLLLSASSFAQTKTTDKKKTGTPAAPMATVVPLGAEKWGDIPPAAMIGTPSVEPNGKLQVAIIQGNPMQAGQPYTLRLSCTAGAKIAPHWHPTTENVTVIKGTFAIGMGTKWDPGALKELPVGGFVSAPARMRHFASCKGDTIVQVHGAGPFVINFVSADKS